MRRVPCEQQLNMDQSVLRDGRTPFGREGRWPPLPPADRKGVWFRSQNPEWRRRAPQGSQCSNATNPEKLAGAPGRVLFSLRRAGHPGMGSSRERGPRPIKTRGHRGLFFRAIQNQRQIRYDVRSGDLYYVIQNQIVWKLPECHPEVVDCQTELKLFCGNRDFYF